MYRLPSHEAGRAHQHRLPADHAPQAAVLVNVEMLQALQGHPVVPAGVLEEPAQQAAPLDGQGGGVGNGMVLLLAVELDSRQGSRAGGKEVRIRHRQAAVPGEGGGAVHPRHGGAAAG